MYLCISLHPIMSAFNWFLIYLISIWSDKSRFSGETELLLIKIKTIIDSLHFLGQNRKYLNENTKWVKKKTSENEYFVFPIENDSF